MSRRDARKIGRYSRIFRRFFPDLWQGGEAIFWLDIGAGYGEILEAVAQLAPKGSKIEGLEPMKPKADHAKARGLRVTQEYLTRAHEPVDVVSLVDVFSHIPRFAPLLEDVACVLKEGGSLFIETGNLADLRVRSEFPGELGLPDHLVFAGESQLKGFLERAGFEVVRIEAVRIDGFLHLAKCVLKRILGRPVRFTLPYTSRYRQLLVRAQLSGAGKWARKG